MPEKKNTILIIEDDPQISKMLRIILEAADYKTVDSNSGKQGTRLSASIKPDLILLDLGLPDIDGKEVIEAVRAWSQLPIIVLSVRSEESEIATALNMGADDYVTKPFSAEILLARINANLRKSATREAGQPELSNGPLRMDLVRHEVYIHDRLVAFTPKEYELLRYLLVNRGKMLTHRQILGEVWGGVYVENTQYLRVFIKQIREKLDGVPELSSVIVTTPGIGYRMEIIE